MIMELRQLVTFRTIAALGSFAAAAGKLNATQPAISARIRALEQELGIALFDRTARPARLTPAGHRLLEQVDVIISATDEIRLAGGGASGQIRSVRLGIPSALVSRWAPFLFAEIYKNNPNARVELHIDRSPILHQMLINGEIDFALTIGQASADDLTSREIGRYGYCWIHNGALPGAKSIRSVADIAKPVATYAKTSAAYAELSSYLRTHKLDHIALSGSNSTDAILRLVNENLAVGLVMSIALEDSIRSGPIAVLDLPTSMISDVVYYASYRRDGDALLGEFLTSAAARFR